MFGGLEDRGWKDRLGNRFNHTGMINGIPGFALGVASVHRRLKRAGRRPK